MAKSYLLDTDICSYLMRENPLSLLERFKEHQSEIYISSITVAEMLFGATKKGSEKLMAWILRLGCDIHQASARQLKTDAAERYSAS